MAFIDNVKRIIQEDFDNEYGNLISRLGYVLNTFMEQTTDVVNGNIDINNTTNEIVTAALTVDASGTPIATSQLKINSVRSILGVMVIRATNTSNPGTYPTTNPLISFTTNRVTDGTIITIQNITGLQANNTYSLNILILT